MARNTATQNPNNKVGRNSGAGPDGISRIAATAPASARGLVAPGVRRGRRWVRPLGLGLVAAGVGAAAYAWSRGSRPADLGARLSRLMGR